MKVIHFLCRPKGRGMTGLSHVAGTTYRSEAWPISEDEAQELVGGSIYLHEAKSKPSRIGGRILGYEVVTLDAADPAARKQRIAFTFESSAEGRNVPWRGQDHDMSMTSGVLDA